MDYNNQNFKNNFEHSVNQNTYYSGNITPVVQKKSKKPIIIGLIIGIIVVAAIIILIVNLSGGPIKKISNACEKTLEKGPFEFELTVEDGSYELTANGIVEVNTEEKYLIFDIEAEEDDYDYRVIFYDNCLAEIYDNDYDDIYYSNLADEDVELIFDLVACFDPMNPGKTDYEQIFNIIDEYTDGELEIEFDKDTEELVKMSEDVVNEYYKKFNDNEWLEECLGYEKDGNTYKFEPDLVALAEDLIEFIEEHEDELEEIYEKAAEIADEDIDPDGFDDFMDIIDDLGDEVDELDDFIDEFIVEITINKGYISSVVYDLEADDDDIHGEITLSEFGDAEFDMDEIEDIIDEGKENVDSAYDEYALYSKAKSANANAKTVYTAASVYVTEYYENPDDAEEITSGCLYSGTIGEYDSDDDRSLMRSINKYMGEDAEGTYWAVYFDEYGNIEEAWWMNEKGDFIGSYPLANDVDDPIFEDWDTLIEDYQDNIANDEYYW